MKKSFALLLAVALGAIGCTTTTPGEKDYQADQPPPIAKADPIPMEKGPPKLPPAHTSVSADGITEANYLDSVRKLDTEMREDKRALSKVGR
jgi:hypothetical protein